MDKRLVIFFIAAMFVIGGQILIQNKLRPARSPQPVAAGNQDSKSKPDTEKPGTEKSETDKPDAGKSKTAKSDIAPQDAGKTIASADGKSDANADGKSDTKTAPAENATPKPAGKDDAQRAADAPQRPTVNPQWVTLGSLNPQSGYRLLVTLNNRGAAIERVELSSPKYRDLENPAGYLGHLVLAVDPEQRGARIQAVGPGTPAARATASGLSEPGLRVGDIITKVAGEPAPSNLVLERELEHLKPGTTVDLTVLRGTTTHDFTVTLDRHPLEVIRPETQSKFDPEMGFPLSCPLELDTIATGTRSASIKRGFKTIDDLPSLVDARWEVVSADEGSVEFRYQLDEATLAAVNQPGSLEIRKRYSLPKLTEAELADETARAYHLDLEIEIRTVDTDARQVAYRLQGVNGLPLEGWWYISKSGARDVVLRTDGTGQRWHKAPAIHKYTVANPRDPRTKLFTDDEPQKNRAVRYIGVDSQYFASILLPQGSDGGPGIFRRATAFGLGDVAGIPASHNRTLNVGCELVSEVTKITADAPLKHRYVLFAGPKDADLLGRYGGTSSDGAGSFNLAELNDYGWFGFVSRPLARVLHGFYWLVGNYGVAIVMLTLLVRSCMLPISYRATKSSQRMQALSPELKRLGEKYKDDAQQRVKAQQELFRKHNVNPLGGCLLAFCQLPIFIGLYRCLSIDIELRQAPLLKGLQWCSNLAGPDMLFRWSDYLPSFLADETGYLGPYLNLLPIITMVLFLANQALMTPPATDEQTRLQQQIMKYMTLFMGFMFFKVPAGLCVYFIASSLWSLAEHKVLRKGKIAVSSQVAAS